MNETTSSTTTSPGMPAPDVAYMPLTRDRQRAKRCYKILCRRWRQARIQAIKDSALAVVGQALMLLGGLWAAVVLAIILF